MTNSSVAIATGFHLANYAFPLIGRSGFLVKKDVSYQGADRNVSLLWLFVLLRHRGRAWRNRQRAMLNKIQPFLRESAVQPQGTTRISRPNLQWSWFSCFFSLLLLSCRLLNLNFISSYLWSIYITPPLNHIFCRFASSRRRTWSDNFRPTGRIFLGISQSLTWTVSRTAVGLFRNGLKNGESVLEFKGEPAVNLRRVLPCWSLLDPLTLLTFNSLASRPGDGFTAGKTLRLLTNMRISHAENPTLTERGNGVRDTAHFLFPPGAYFRF
jgi:hypothetical protein